MLIIKFYDAKVQNIFETTKYFVNYFRFACKIFMVII